MFYILEISVFWLHTMNQIGILSLNITLKYTVITSKCILRHG
jgi:hypothetical protein